MASYATAVTTLASCVTSRCSAGGLLSMPVISFCPHRIYDRYGYHRPIHRSMVNIYGSSPFLSARSFRLRRGKTDQPTQHCSAKDDDEGDNKSDAKVSFKRQDRIPTMYDGGIPPSDPRMLIRSEQDIQRKTDQLLEWFQRVGNQNILALTGAGISTESGIPDYRGHEGSYHKGHQPMIHDQFMSSEYQRKRYWGRGMVRNFFISLIQVQQIVYFIKLSPMSK
jgi:Sir2 family